MTSLSVVILSADDEQRAILQMQVDATAVVRTVQTLSTLPVATTDLTIRRLQGLAPEVIIVDIPKQGADAVLHAIELLHANVPKSAIVAVGDTSQPHLIISAMRAGAREFLERPTSTTAMLDAFVRLTSAERKSTGVAKRGKLITFLNAKGGSGATTLAVNTALALQEMHSNVALVDLAPIGHVALHLNQKPAFTILDALHNVQRLDASLLEAYLGHCPNGLHFLAGSTEPTSDFAAPGDYARLFDTLLGFYSYLVVDASSRMDQTVRVVSELSHRVLIVSQPDIASLWSTAKVQGCLHVATDRLGLVLNRFRKIPGLNDNEIEAATHIKVLWKIPNHYAAVAGAIDSGTPVVQQNHSEIARCFVGLASHLSGNERQQTKRRTFSLFGAE